MQRWTDDHFSVRLVLGSNALPRNAVVEIESVWEIKT